MRAALLNTVGLGTAARAAVAAAGAATSAATERVAPPLPARSLDAARVRIEQVDACDTDFELVTHAEAVERDAEQEGHRGTSVADAVRDDEQEAAAVDSYYSAAEAAVPNKDARAVAAVTLREARREPRNTTEHHGEVFGGAFGAEEAAAMVDAIGVPIFAVARPSRAASPASSTASSATPGANALMMNADSEMLFLSSGGRDFDVTVRHLSRTLATDPAIQRAILANEELQAILRLVMSAYPCAAAADDAETAAAAAAAGGEAAPAEPQAPEDHWSGFAAALRAAAAAAAESLAAVPHDVHAARVAAGAALRRLLQSAAARVASLFTPPPLSSTNGGDAIPRQRSGDACHVIVTLDADEDASAPPVRVTLRVVPIIVKKPAVADAADDVTSAGGAANGVTPEENGAAALAALMPQLLEAALLVAAAALALLLLRRRGVPLDALLALLRRDKGA